MAAEGPKRISVALATSTGAWDVDDDGPVLLSALIADGIDAVPAVWDDPTVDWSTFDLVVLRSTWDYTDRHQEFLEWIDRIDPLTTVVNPAATIRWNTDKRYLADLAQRGVAVVATSFLLADDAPAADEVRRVLVELLDTAADDRRELVVKPTVSAGSKDTARYAEDQLDDAIGHALRVLGEGRDVMVQPYISSVDDRGETGMVLIDGAFSHAFRKGALLLDGPADVDGLFAVEQISATTPTDAELALARSVLSAATEILEGVVPRYARVDVLQDANGEPTLLELELAEPSFFLWTSPASVPEVVRAIRGWA